MQPDPLVRRAQPWLGTLVEVAVPSQHAGLIDSAFKTIAEVHYTMSFHTETSDLARLRCANVDEVIEVSSQTVSVLRTASHLFQLTGGVFDVTTAAELVAWGFLPRPDGWIDDTAGGTAADIEIIDDTHVCLKKPLLIDLGGIAKGYAVDAAIETLKDGGAETGVVNAGGDLRVFGETAYPITVRAADWSGPVEELSLQDGAVATSANVDSRIRNGRQMCAPHVGGNRKAALYNGSVSTFAPLAIHADALTKVALCDAALAKELAGHFDAEFLFCSLD